MRYRISVDLGVLGWFNLHFSHGNQGYRSDQNVISDQKDLFGEGQL